MKPYHPDTQLWEFNDKFNALKNRVVLSTAGVFIAAIIVTRFVLPQLLLGPLMNFTGVIVDTMRSHPRFASETEADALVVQLGFAFILLWLLSSFWITTWRHYIEHAGREGGWLSLVDLHKEILNRLGHENLALAHSFFKGLLRGVPALFFEISWDDGHPKFRLRRMGLRLVYLGAVFLFFKIS